MIDYTQFVKDFPPEIATMLVAMLPVGELRGAIPFALAVYDMPFWKVFLFAVIGNMVPVIFILWLLDPVSKFLMERSKIMNRLFTWLFEKTRKKHSEKFKKWEELALITFVAIPLPVTGGWSGSVAAFVFGVPFKKALPLIFIGILISAGIVSLLSLGVVGVIASL